METLTNTTTAEKGTAAEKQDKCPKTKGDRRKPNKSRRGGKFGRGTPRKAGNDFAFWNEYPELMSIATRIPWMHIAGTPLEGAGVNTPLPNVAVQHYFSLPGVCRASTDPLNLSFRQAYLDLHRKYRGVGGYQASDIGIAFLCIESVFQLLIEAERVYGIFHGYPIKSRIEPEGLLFAMGYNGAFINDVKNHLADYRYSINRLIELAKRLPLPSGMSFFKNHVAMNGFVYKDSADERADLLVYVFDNYYVWQTTGDARCVNLASTAASVKFDRIVFNSYEDLINLISSVLQTLLTDSDVLRITSDFIACYGESAFQILAPLPEDYAVVPVYSEAMLSKWHNSERIYLDIANPDYFGYIAVGSSTQLASSEFVVYQNNDVICSLPVITDGNGWDEIENTGDFAPFGICGYTNADVAKGYVCDTWMAQPTDEIICESMLWKAMVKKELSNDGTMDIAVIYAASTEVLTRLDVIRVNNGSAFMTTSYPATIQSQDPAMDVRDGLLHFDWHPYVFNRNGVGQIIGIQGDTDNITVVSKDVILKVMDAANLSAYKIVTSSRNSGSNLE